MDTDVRKGSAHNMHWLRNRSIHCVVTSPPYFNQRDYGNGKYDIGWPAVSYAPMVGLGDVFVPAWTGSLGSESTIEAYIGHLILVMREVHRVLRDDGLAWVNLGDSYNGSGGAGGDYAAGGIRDGQPKFKGSNVPGLKAKDMCYIPARFALAAQADGWYLRHEIPWVKRNVMPGSQNDRPVTAKESIFLLAKTDTSYADPEAVRVGGGRTRSLSVVQRELLGDVGDVTVTVGTTSSGHRRRDSDWFFDSLSYILGGGNGMILDEGDEPLALVVNTKGFGGKHYAAWPVELVEPMIRFSTSERGVCPGCGSPWERVQNKTVGKVNASEGLAQRERNDGVKSGGVNNVTLGVTDSIVRETVRWQPTCDCGEVPGWPSVTIQDDNGENSDRWASDPIPAIVLDPFHGTGASGVAAIRNRRSYAGVDVSEEYLGDIDRISFTQIRMMI